MATPEASVAQRIARYTLIGALMALGAWMLQHFLPGAVLGRRCSRSGRPRSTTAGYGASAASAGTSGPPCHFTSLVGIVLIVPLVYGGIVAVREAISLARSFLDSTTQRVRPPRAAAVAAATAVASVIGCTACGSRTGLTAESGTRCRGEPAGGLCLDPARRRAARCED